MPGVFRSLADRVVWAGVVGLGLAGPAVADDGPELPAAPDPIAASNRLTDPFHRPAVILLTAAEAPWLNPPAGEPLAAPPVPPHAVAPPPPPVQQPVTWSAPRRQPAPPPPLPTSDRPMMPCEPVAIAPPPPPLALAAPRMEAPPAPEPLPPPRPLAPVEAPPPPPKAEPKPKPAMTATTDDDFRAPKPITTCRFLDDPPAAKPAADDTVMMAVLRRGGPAAGSAADIRKAVEAACKKAVECQTEVAGERQVRVMLTVRSMDDWHRFYARLQDLSDLGEYGLLFQVRVEKESK